MFGINLNAVSLLSTVALGPAGGIGVQLATQLFGNMSQQLLQGMGERLNLPQTDISAAIGSHIGFGGPSNQDLQSSINDMGQRTGASISDIATAQRETQATLDNVLNELSQGDDVKDAKAGGKGKGWLMALAEVLGAKMDDLADRMGSMAREISDGAASKSSEFTVLAQEFGLVMNAANTSIKTIGEAMNNTARKG